ncbi:CRISPR-associated protein Cas10/Csm1, subtype III-A/MTUBE [Candidatus Fervidibacteria bacterium JGI MDM2 SSWTFF-3-K9]
MLSGSQVVALAGLFHDLGKFRQRAFWGERKRHETHGSEWLTQTVLPRLTFLTEQEQAEIAQVVERHHEPAPYERDIRIVKIADQLASGERVQREGEEVGDPSQELLIPVFVRLKIGNRFLPFSEQGRWRYETTPLRLGDSIFPKPHDQLRADYPSLWDAFERTWLSLPNNAPTFRDFDAFVLTWLSLLRAYAWCVPAAAYRDEPDISLADHLQVTGALAFCLWELDDTTVELLEPNPLESKTEVVLLVGGDITGIQRFIYTISSKGAAKSLRGRSAYLNLLCDAIAEWLRRKLQVPPCNIIYSSGGHFYLLAPLSKRDEIDKLRLELLDLLFDFFGGELAIVIEAVPLRACDFKIDPNANRSPLGERWAELAQRLSQRKGTLWRERIVIAPNSVFGPFGQGGETETCDVCHSEPDEPAGLVKRGLRRSVEPKMRGDEIVWRCSLCESFEELADRIWRAKFLLLRPHHQQPCGALQWHSILQALGLELWLDDENELVNHYRRGDWVLRINDADLTPVYRNGIFVPVIGFRFLPQHTPTVTQNGVQRIADLTELSERSQGAPYYGVLRMDVDSLGRLFAEGLGGMASLSRLATLSRLLTVFFEGYLNEICRQVAPERLYLLYSGGDDLFAVGSWDAVIGLAEKVRWDFRCYTCHNPCMTVSAGVSVHHDKFPLYQAAEIAKGYLEAAKNFEHPDGHEKDAFGFWGRVVDWDETQKWLRNWHDKLVEWLETRQATRALLFKLARIAELHEEIKRRLERKLELSQQEVERRLKFEKWRWRLVYTLAREKTELQSELKSLQEDLVQRDFIRHLLLLTRWTELSTRR